MLTENCIPSKVQLKSEDKIITFQAKGMMSKRQRKLITNANLTRM